MKRWPLWILAATLWCASAPATSRGSLLAVVGGKLLTVTHGVVENGTLLVKDGRIVAVGKNLPVPPGARVIHAEGKVICPGFIDSGNRLGLVEIEREKTTHDSEEDSGPIQARIRAADSLNPASETIRVARAEGITASVITPTEGNPVSGQSAIIRLDGASVPDMVIKEPAALLLTLGSSSRNRPGVLGRMKSDATSRMGTMALIRQAFLDAEAYREAWKGSARKRGEAPPKKDLNLDVLLKALEGKLPVVVSARRRSDLEEALALAREFRLKLILSHATEAYQIAGKLASWHVPVVVGPVLEGPVSVETKNAREDNAAILTRAGVLVAFQTDDVLQVRDLPFQVEYAIGSGLPDVEALKAVTLNPARIFGVEKDLGSLQPGKLADFLVLDGMPFHHTTHVEAEYIRGKKVDLTNHQTRLFDFYRNLYHL